MKDGNLKKVLFVIFIVALSLRLFTVVTQKESERVPRSDASNYDYLAMNIASGQGFSEIIDGKMGPTANRTPGYPLFLAGIYVIFGHNYMAVKIIQAILGALLCLVVFFIVSTIYENKRIGVISSGVTAIYKPYVSGFNYYGGPALLLSEYFYMFILGLAILTTVLFLKKHKKIFGILSGILIGLTIMIRPDFIFYPFLLALYLFYTLRFSLKKLIKKYLAMYLFIILILASWMVRNYVVFERFVPFTTYSGLMLWLGNNPSANGGNANPGNYREKIYDRKDLTVHEKNEFFFKKGIEELKNNPRRIPGLFVKKILVHWAPFEDGFKLFNLYYAIIILLASIGILFLRGRTIMENAILTIFFSTTLRAVIIWGDPRYRYSYEFCLIIFAALTIDKIFTTIRQRRALAL